MRLEEITAQALLTGIIPGSVVQVVACHPIGPDTVNLVFKGAEGRLQERMLFRSDEAHIAIAVEGRPWGLDGNAGDFKLGAEAYRIHLAHLFDPLMAKEALTFFGDEAMAGSAAGAYEKGRRLAQLVGERRALLILDGVEPLQYAPSSTAFPPGQLKDQGVAALLKGLAAASHGLCVVTTRYSLPDLKAFWQTTAPEVKLLRLSHDAGVHLLKTLGVTGTAQEFATLVEDVKGHALTLTLLGGFLKRAFHGDIRQRDRVKFEKADEKMDGGHAFRTMAAYEQWLLSDGGDEGRREVALLRLMGLFDRPADAGCLTALRSETIPGLTEPLAGLADDDWEYCLTGLEAAKLLTVNRDAAGALVSLNAHPLLREYFARQLRTQHPDAWRAAHRRLYEHLCATTPDKAQPTLEDLQPLYQAVAHGCQAGFPQEAFDIILWKRIRREKDAYSVRRLGAYGVELAILSHYFETPWTHPVPAIHPKLQAWLLHAVGFALWAQGRLSEALGAFESGFKRDAAAEDWRNASRSAINIMELGIILGRLKDIPSLGEQAIGIALESDGDLEAIVIASTLAHGLHQLGHMTDAKQRFAKIECLQGKREMNHPLLYSFQGFQYCDVLLADAECTAWRASLSLVGFRHLDLIETCDLISKRAAETLSWEVEANWLLETALDRLTRGRATLYAVMLEGSKIANRESDIDLAVCGLHRAGQHQYLPLGLLTRAWLRFLTGAGTGPESAQADLDEAWEIAERGPMRLHMADIHLYRARLFFRAKDYPWQSPAADLAAAEKLINECGYHRRDGELADAKRAILGT
jgi:hypothetical protein